MANKSRTNFEIDFRSAPEPHSGAPAGTLTSPDTHMKIQLAGLTDELERELTTLEVEPADWDSSLWAVRDALGTVGACIDIDFVSGENYSSIIISYFSEKLKKSVIVEWTDFCPCDTVRELAEYLVGFHDEARALEARISLR